MGDNSNLVDENADSKKGRVNDIGVLLASIDEKTFEELPTQISIE